MSMSSLEFIVRYLEVRGFSTSKETILNELQKAGIVLTDSISSEALVDLADDFFLLARSNRLKEVIKKQEAEKQQYSSTEYETVYTSLGAVIKNFNTEIATENKEKLAEVILSNHNWDTNTIINTVKQWIEYQNQILKDDVLKDLQKIDQETDKSFEEINSQLGGVQTKFFRQSE